MSATPDSTMKALSLWQPWATLVAIGQKKVETRSWATSYRGPLLICSTQKTPADVFQKATTDPRFYERMKVAPIGYTNGAALCVVDLVSCEPAEKWKGGMGEAEGWEAIARESIFGDLSPGRFAWQLADLRPLWRWHNGVFGGLEKLIDVKGRQGLWTVQPELLEKVTAALSVDLEPCDFPMCLTYGCEPPRKETSSS